MTTYTKREGDKMKYVEQDCCFDFEGKTFCSEGAAVTPEGFVGYMHKSEDGSYSIVSWKGDKVIADKIHIIRHEKHIRNSWLSNEKIWFHCVIDGTAYSGKGFGENMICRGRRMKSKNAKI